MLFDGAAVEDNARVVNSVVGNGARVEESAVVFDTVIGDRAVVGAHCELRHGMRIWPDVVLPPHGVRFSPDV
jgi:mannose-1-phosphate guanylyltransferase